MARSVRLMPIAPDGQPFAQQTERVLLSMVPRLMRHYPCLESDDVLIEVLEEAGRRILRHEHNKGTIASLHGYAWVTLRSVAVTHLRGRVGRLRSQTMPWEEGGRMIDRAQSELATPRQIEAGVLLEQLLTKLSPAERRMCLWKRDGLSSLEIAALRGGSVAAVDTFWLRIRRKLARVAGGRPEMRTTLLRGGHLGHHG